MESNSKKSSEAIINWLLVVGAILLIIAILSNGKL